jgi:hypothetical protein
LCAGRLAAFDYQRVVNFPWRTNSVTLISSELRWVGWLAAPMLASCSSVSSILYLVGVQVTSPSKKLTRVRVLVSWNLREEEPKDEVNVVYKGKSKKKKSKND